MYFVVAILCKAPKPNLNLNRFIRNETEQVRKFKVFRKRALQAKKRKLKSWDYQI